MMTTKLEQAARQVVANGVQGTYAKYYSVPPADFEVLREALAEQTEQEPVAWMYTSKHTNDSTLEWYQVADNFYDDHIETPLYAAPVRTKDLTDDEIMSILNSIPADGWIEEMCGFARAVIAADREKNK